jgi:rhodanese-related sulfurtransferase
MQITITELKQRLAANELENFFDVREEWEYDEDNLGAKLMPLGDLPHRISEIAHLKHTEIIIHCKSGARAGQAQKYLNAQGFTLVKNVTGGIEAFRAQ